MEARRVKLGLAQVNPTVGDIEGNTDRIIHEIERGRSAGAKLLVFPEMAVFGYPPKDLLLRRDLVAMNVAAVDRIARYCRKVTAIVGFVQPDPSGSGRGAMNAAAVCCDGAVVGTYAKMLLPTYDVFDEARYFNAGTDVCVVSIRSVGESVKVGVTICEDLWNDRQFEGRRVYGVDPIGRTVAAGAELLVNLSASPYRVFESDW